MPHIHGIIAPHPISILPHETNQEVIGDYEKLIKTYLETAQKIAAWQPERVVIMSSRGSCYLEGPSIHNPHDNHYIAKLAEIKEEDRYYPAAKATIHSIIKQAEEQGQTLVTTDQSHLDAGAIVPLYYLLSACNEEPDLIYLNMGHSSLDSHFQLGKLMQKISEIDHKRTLFIASSTAAATHKGSPYGYNKHAASFDKELINDLEQNNYEHVTLNDPFLVEELGVAGLHCITTLLGFIHEHKLPFQKIDYAVYQGIGELFASTL